MGVDTRITLVPGCKVNEVADVIGLAAGLPGHLVPLHQARGYEALRVEGVRVSSCESVPEMAEITLRGPMVDGETIHTVFYHFEWDRGEVPGVTGLMPRMSPFWIAIALRVTEFFGGWVDFCDCDSTDVDVAFPVNHRHASDGQPWQDHQYAMAAVQPITDDELAEARRIYDS